jgi:cysteine desulfurase/selenocysteine lyase
MTTPDLSAAFPAVSDVSSVPPEGGALLAASEIQAARAAGAPDPSLIARLANQFFSALPGSAAAPASKPPPFAPALAAAPSTPARIETSAASAAASRLPKAAPPAAFSPGPEDLRKIPSTLGGALSLLPLRLAAPWAVDERVSKSGFYFVDEAAVLGNAAKASPEALSSAPLRFDALPVVQELVERHPNRAPGIGLASARPFDPRAIRDDFPILREQVNGKPLIWLDNAATTQKPQSVIDRLRYFYEHENSNIHRGAHTLAARATDAYEEAREKVRAFLNAESAEQIVFVRGATEAINLVAKAWGAKYVGPGDEIIISWLEHHANIVPWQQLAAEKDARLRVIPVDDGGDLIVEEYERLLNPRTKIVAVTQVSNVLGTVTPTQAIVDAAHRHGARVLIDGAQSALHHRADVQALDADFFVFSGHKVLGPTGIGALYGKKDALEEMPPWQGGGNMIADVTFERTLFQPIPAKFEAGTGNIADAAGLGAALDYVGRLGVDNIARYERELIAYAIEALKTIPGLSILGNPKERAGVLSLTLDGFRSEDVGAHLAREGIAVRSGHHCAQPILRRFGLESSVRPSFAPYNTCDDIDALARALRQLRAQG